MMITMTWQSEQIYLSPWEILTLLTCVLPTKQFTNPIQVAVESFAI